MRGRYHQCVERQLLSHAEEGVDQLIELVDWKNLVGTYYAFIPGFSSSARWWYQTGRQDDIGPHRLGAYVPEIHPYGGYRAELEFLDEMRHFLACGREEA